MALPNEVAPPKPPFVIKGRWRGVAATEGLGGVTAQRRNTAQALAQGGAKSEAAKRLEPRGHGAKRSPQGRNTAQALAQGGAKSEAAKRLEPRGHGAKRSPQGRNTAQALAQGGAKTSNRKIPPANRGFINAPPAKGLRDTGRSR